MNTENQTAYDDDPIYELRQSVDALTKPVAAVEWVEADGKRVIFRRTDQPLLEQIRAAISSDIGGGGGGKPARERTPMDIGAFTIHETIDGRVRSWLEDCGGRAGKDLTPGQVLRTWYTLWTAQRREPGIVGAFTNIIDGWVAQIRDHLDPPNPIELRWPCPLCGVEWRSTGEGAGMDTSRVLWAMERETLEESYGVCRACTKVWRGVSQMRQLRILIDDREAARIESEARATGGVA